MRLYVAREMTLPIDIKDNEYCPSLQEWLQLQEILECYDSFNEVLRALSNKVKKTNVQIRYPALNLKNIPTSSVGDWLITVVNIFGDVAAESEDHKVPSGLSKTFLLAKMCEEMNVTERNAKQWLGTLMHGHYLVESFGLIKFPTHLLASRSE